MDLLQPLIDYATELRRIYGLQCEIDASLRQWHDYLATCQPDKHMFFGRGDPNDQSSSFQYWALISDLSTKSARDGENSRRLRRMAIVFAYTQWDVEARQQIASACGKEKNDILHPVFGDLNKLRQAVVHVSGRVDKNLEAMKFVQRGDVVDLSNEQFYELFKTLTLSLNDIAERYFSVRTDFTFDQRFEAPKPTI